MAQTQLIRVLGGGASLLTFLALTLSRLSAAARVSAMEARPSSLQQVWSLSSWQSRLQPHHLTCPLLLNLSTLPGFGLAQPGLSSSVPPQQQEHLGVICCSAHLSKLGVLRLSRSPAAAAPSAASSASLPAAGAASAFLLPPILALGSGAGQEPLAAAPDSCCLVLCLVTLAGALEAAGAAPPLADCWLLPAQAGWVVGCAAAGCARCCCSCQPATTLRGLCLTSFALPFLGWPAPQQQD